MVGKLTIKSLGPIKDATIDLKQFIFFIGGQGVGKSTLAKMLCVVTDGRIYSATSEEVATYMFRTALGELNILSYLSDETSVEYYDECVFRYEGGREDVYSLSMTYFDNKCKISIQKNGDEAGGADRMKFIICRSFSDRGVKKSLDFLKDDRIPDIEKFDSMRDSLYIPAERIMYAVSPKLLPALNMVGETLPRNLLLFMIEYGKAKAANKEYDVPVFDVKFRATEEKDFIDLPEKENILFSEVSSGMQSSIPLLLTMDYALTDGHFHFYVVEEPESNLFPENQVALLDKIVKGVNDAKHYASLIVTTHSPYIINYLNVLLRRHTLGIEGAKIDSKDLAVYFVNEDGSVNSLIAQDEDNGEYVVDTYDLSEPMEQIFNLYKSMG